MVGHAHRIPMELMGTMVEVADVAWNALEHRRERKIAAEEEEETAHLRSENHRLKVLLAENLPLLHGIAQVPSLATNCPPDLYARLLAVVDTPSFVATLESLKQEIEAGPNGGLPHTKRSGQEAVDVEVNFDENDPNWWVLVNHDMAPDILEEASGIDKENYVVISEENVVDGIANFIARCILENPKSKVISPQELQKAVSKALGDIKGRSILKSLWDAGIVIYTLSTWGIFLAGLYKHRAIVKAAGKGVHTSTKFILKAL
ncbi:hypothetical protein AXF42_Ash010815 [Apostasia shenzhenica]|uniref:Uncharacterized protein n=1 Tax=Apostasia shenzhenica TaxID=1088818 RepID=A0A2I0A0Q5_9ASPA|nr:hypothetical protein AXF42_Ash010815 [Apostasia shenzhenica]